VKGLKGNAVFAVVQFEYATRDQSLVSMYGQLPSPIAVLTLDQDPATGKLTLAGYSNVDTSKAHGLWITCGASLSPWNTHLSSEEYEPDATTIAGNSQFKGFSRSLYGDETTANPYHYGHLPEVTVNPDGTGTIKKHYCLGRISHELIQVMPDKRTVLMGDDATNGGLFMFIADREADLSAGTLYVAKWTQVSAAARARRRCRGSTWATRPATKSRRSPTSCARATSWTSRPKTRSIRPTRRSTTTAPSTGCVSSPA
jgi:secreted PhoX family phosphatase